MTIEKLSKAPKEPDPESFDKEIDAAREHLRGNQRAELMISDFDGETLKKPEGLEKFNRAFVFDPLGAPLKMYRGKQEVFIFGPVNKKDREKVFESLGFKAANSRMKIVHSPTAYMGNRKYYVPN